MQSTIKTIVVAFVISLAVAQSAFAVGSSGFENASYSARSLGKGNAVVADPEEASTVAFNPAGMTKLDGVQVNGSTTMIIPVNDYTSAVGAIDDGTATPFAVVPVFFVSMQTPIEHLYVGAGSNSPFGLLTQYSSVGSFKYSSYFNEIQTANYYLSGAYQVTDWLSLGGGWTYMDAGLKQVGKFNSNFLTSSVIPGTINLPDAPFELDVDGHGVGWNVGGLVTISPNDAIGVFYRSMVRAALEGGFSVDNIQGLVLPTVFGGPTFNTSAATDITFPDNLTIGYNHKFSDNFNLETDFGWTNWSEFDKVDILFGTSNTVLNGFEPVNEDFNDTFSFHIAGSYDLTSTWNIVGGYFYYERAANRNNYSNAIPDGDRHGATVGLQYKGRSYAINLSYEGIFVASEHIDNNVGSSNGTSVDGEYSGFVNVISLGVSYHT